MRNRLLSSATIGEANRALVLRTLYRNGPMSRANLASHLNVSRTTITAIVASLIEAGMLKELAATAVTSSGGKPPKPLWFAEALVGAVYISAATIDVALVSTEGRIVDRVDGHFTSNDDPTSTTQRLRERFDELFRGQALLGIGVGVAGTVNTTEGRSLISHRTPFVTNLPLGSLLTQWYGVPTAVDVHPRVQGLGDQWFGLGRELDNFVSVYADEVLGVGMIQEGKTLRGADGAGGEAGHMVVDRMGRLCECGRTGCWETVATTLWLRTRAIELGMPKPELLGPALLAQQAEQGSTAAARLLHEYGEGLGLGLANIEQLLGLGTYIIHGAATQGGEKLRQILHQSLVAGSPQRDTEPQVLFATDPDEMTILGAAARLLSRVYTPFV